MDKVIKIFRDLQNNSGNKLKEILEENKDNQTLKDVLYFIYNPYIITGLSSKKIHKDLSNMTITKVPLINEEGFNINNMFDYIKNHNTGRDEDIAYIQYYLNSIPVQDRDIYEKIFTKELKLGITAKTINKVWKDFIPEFNVMLAEKYADRISELEENKPDIIITQKLDGIRCCAILGDNGVQFFTRQGKLILGLLDLENEFKNLDKGVYDGELLANINCENSKDLYRETVSIVNSKLENKKNIIFNVFDFINLEDFEKGYSDTLCEDRKVYLVDKLFDKNLKWINPVPVLYKGEYNKDIVNSELQKQIDLKNEGIMINYSKAPYQAKRNKFILKVKQMQSADLKVIGFEEGTGKNKNTLGAIIVNYKGYEVKVGSGFTEEDRDYIWKNKDKIINTIIEVQYFEETTNKKDNSLSLRFPVFLRYRNDKTEESYY